jgi:hypothetical protein
LISGRIKLDQINEGFAALKSGAPVRQGNRFRRLIRIEHVTRSIL